jgi:hypothetical protein
VATCLSLSAGVGGVHRLLQGNDEFVCRVVWKRKGYVGLGCLSLGKSPTDCVLGVVGYAFLGM